MALERQVSLLFFLSCQRLLGQSESGTTWCRGEDPPHQSRGTEDPHGITPSLLEKGFYVVPSDVRRRSNV